MSFNGNMFDPKILAYDLWEVRDIYSTFFNTLSFSDWQHHGNGGHEEWNLRETVAHLCALNGDGLESIQCALNGGTFEYEGLPNRYKFSEYNRKGIAKQISLPIDSLRTDLLGILDQAAITAYSLCPEQFNTSIEMPIYNRPVKVYEGLSIIMFHTGLHHSAQVAEPAGRSPLWVHLSPPVRHRTIGRVMRALSLLYRYDLGKDLTATIAFCVDGEGGGEWYVKVSPERCVSGKGPVDDPTLTIHLQNTDIFCQMFTSRLNIPLAILSGKMRLRGNLLLFTKFKKLFSVDAR